MSILLGEVLDDKYRIQRPVGEGGMGLVLEALHLRLDQRVAIKMLVGGALRTDEAVARFTFEARAAARIQSEHAVRVFDVSTLPNGIPYLVMEYLEGRDLEATLRRSGPMAVTQAVTYVLQACEALAEAHASGIVHRDLKPANLFLAERLDGSLRIKILDFGVSKLLSSGAAGEASYADDVALPHAAPLVGSPLYMAPEQMRDAKRADPRADIWSLGIILYELLAGAAPFAGETLTEVCASIVTDPPRPLAPGRTDVPAPLEAVVTRCLAKDPAERFQNVAELARALQPFAPEQAFITVPRTARVLSRGELGSASALATLPRDTRSASQGVLLALAGAGLLLLVASVVGLLVQREPVPASEAARATHSARAVSAAPR
ncbi:serine/threonine-protein kinase [Pendulispora albinea]|uniref:Serine/threonine protein kinase n=1 Tax=Pendulispora albinea TaxID=2741071 RepID=A0ABZ2LPT7_9BACT